LGNIKDRSGAEKQALLLTGLVVFRFAPHGHDDLDPCLAFANLAMELEPGLIADDLGGLGPLGEDEDNVAPTVAMETDLDVEVATEGVSVLDFPDCLFQGGQDIRSR